MVLFAYAARPHRLIFLLGENIGPTLTSVNKTYKRLSSFVKHRAGGEDLVLSRVCSASLACVLPTSIYTNYHPHETRRAKQTVIETVSQVSLRLAGHCCCFHLSPGFVLSC